MKATLSSAQITPSKLPQRRKTPRAGSGHKFIKSIEKPTTLLTGCLDRALWNKESLIVPLIRIIIFPEEEISVTVAQY